VVEPSSASGSCLVTTISPADEAADDNSQLLTRVLSVIRRDVIAADLKWSLFVAASQSYKHDSCLRPFPPMFLVDGNKDISALREAIEAVPAFSQLEVLGASLSRNTLLLLHWVLLDLKEPTLTTVDKSEVRSVMGLVSSELSAPRPSLVLRLASSEVRWQATRGQLDTLHAFHGSKLENFHSILHYGLQQHLTKNALFGQGVYTSSELLVCLPYSRTGLGWPHSCVASQLSMVALCEVIDHPSVKCQAAGGSGGQARALAPDSIAGQVPHKIYVVPNSELVRVRYLLVYPSAPSQLKQNQPRSGVLLWIGRHKMAVGLAAYAIMLASVGLTRSATMIHVWQAVCKALGLH